MVTSKRAALRLALAGGLALAGLSYTAAQGWAAAPPEKTHPDSTVLFVKAQNAAALRESFKQSQYGQLWADPALKPFREELASRIEVESKRMKEKVGVTLRELIELPQGVASIAVLPKEDAAAKPNPEKGGEPAPFAIVMTADAGKNAAAMSEVLNKATKQGEETGAKVSHEDYKGHAIHVIQPPPPKEKEKADKEAEPPSPPIICVFTFEL